MTIAEKISHALTRTNELQILIKCWNDSHQGNAKIVNAQKRISELQILMKCWNDPRLANPKIVNFPISVEKKVA